MEALQTSVLSIRRVLFISGWVLFFGSCALRFLWYETMTSDYIYFVRPWFDYLQSHSGLSAFSAQFADYAPAYLYLLKFATLTSLSSLASAKAISLVCDVAGALIGYVLLRDHSPWKGRRDVAFFGATVLFALPTVMVNSSLWGQSDSVYAVFALASLLFILRDKALKATVVFGVAVSIKVQAIFFAPLILGYLLRRRIHWKYILVPPLVFLLSVLPAGLLGGEFWYWLTIYAHQASEYPYLSVSAQSVFAFVQPLSLSPDLTAVLFWAGVTTALVLTLALAYYALRTQRFVPERIVLIALSGALLLPYFLPRMHERYFYLADIFAVLYAFFLPKRIPVAILVVFTSLISYVPFLSGQLGALSGFQVDLRVPALLLLVPIVFVLKDLWASRAKAALLSTSHAV